MRSSKQFLVAACLIAVIANMASATMPLIYSVEPDEESYEDWIGTVYVGNYKEPPEPNWWWLAQSYTSVDMSYPLAAVSVYAYGPGTLEVRMSEGDEPGDLGESTLLGTWSGPSGVPGWRNIYLATHAWLEEGRKYWFWYSSQDTTGEPAPIIVPYFFDEAMVGYDYPEPMDCRPTADGSGLEWGNLHGDEAGYGLRLYAAPEPISLALLGVFGGAAALARRRRVRS